MQDPLFPVLNYKSAKHLAAMFYFERWSEPDGKGAEKLIYPSKLQKFSLWTGPTDRVGSSLDPERELFERTYAANFCFFPPLTFGREPDLHHLQR